MNYYANAKKAAKFVAEVLRKDESVPHVTLVTRLNSIGNGQKVIVNKGPSYGIDFVLIDGMHGEEGRIVVDKGAVYSKFKGIKSFSNIGRNGWREYVIEQGDIRRCRVYHYELVEHHEF